MLLLINNYKIESFINSNLVKKYIMTPIKGYVRALGLFTLVGVTWALSEAYLVPIGHQRQLVPLTSEQRTEIDTIDKSVKLAYTKLAQECLSESELVVAHLLPSKAIYGKVPIGKYDKVTHQRLLDERILGKPKSFRPVIRHESTHRVDDCGLIDEDKIMKVYEAMNADEYPVKKIVEARLAQRDPEYSDMPAETIAEVVNFWWRGYSVSPDMERALATFIDSPRVVIMRRIDELLAMDRLTSQEPID